MVFLYLILILGFLALDIFFIYLGVKQCKENNATGLIWMFLGLSFLGLVIGYVLLSKAKTDQGIDNPNPQPDNDEWIYDATEDVWKRKEN